MEIFLKEPASHLKIASPLAALQVSHDKRSARFLYLCQIISDLQSEAFGEYILGSKEFLRESVFVRVDDAQKTCRMSSDQMSLAIDRYDKFYEGLLFLKGVMHLAATRKEAEPSRLVEGLKFFASAYIDENDGLHIELPPFVQSLLHDDVEISRIKKCANKNCERIFWAGRIDQKCCPSPRGQLSGCAHAYRNQQYREKKKRSEDKLRFRQGPLTERKKREKVRDAILRGLRTENAIAKETKLQLSEVNRLAIKLVDDGQVDVQTVRGELEYSATGATKKIMGKGTRVQVTRY
jgi:hypothetical protein